jgi:hypothetical protein
MQGALGFALVWLLAVLVACAPHEEFIAISADGVAIIHGSCR